jgi:hypothetical protein
MVETIGKMNEQPKKMRRGAQIIETPPVVIVVPATGPIYLPGARLLAVLAQPPLRQGDHSWMHVERAFARLYIEERQSEEPSWAEQAGSLIPVHATLALVEANKTNKRAQKALHARMGAAHVVIGLVRRAGLLNGDVPHQHRPQPTIDQEIQRTLEGESVRKDWVASRGLVESARFDNTIDNFDNRALRPSLPVIHIAAAVASQIQRSQRAAAGLPAEQTANMPEDVGGPQISWRDFLRAPELALGVIAEAGDLENIMAQPQVPRPRPGVPRVHLRLE